MKSFKGPVGRPRKQAMEDEAIEENVAYVANIMIIRQPNLQAVGTKESIGDMSEHNI